MSTTIGAPTRNPSTKSTNKETQTYYQLPSAVEALRAGWLATFQGGATYSALLAAIEAGLLVFFHDDVNFGAEHQSCRCNSPKWITTTPQKCILILTYLSLVLSLTVTVTSYSLIAELSIFLPARAAKDTLLTYNPPNTMTGSNWDILRHYGLNSWASHSMRFWVFSLIGAILCAALSVAIFVGTREDGEIQAVVLVSVGFFVLPVLFLIRSFRGE